MPSLTKIHVQPEQIVEFLRRNIRYQEILYQQVIAQSAQERGLTVSAEEIQAEGDRMRREKRLEKAADTLAWLTDEMITPEDWEAGIYARLLFKQWLASELNYMLHNQPG